MMDKYGRGKKLNAREIIYIFIMVRQSDGDDDDLMDGKGRV